ncbi:hypothetical protein [Paraburkholderia unamae]|uniref:O-antigen ligase-like membrane protein n=1 Tax=Paraburkholderia unamae TaxID=219649 RepID=A0ABX5KIZ4_9BURK|nr:hypothetical protein [Paraburkholderia unamae]PVX77966.1 hypothetical protein C7402_114197 [Paraburkholderia unamae]
MTTALARSRNNIVCVCLFSPLLFLFLVLYWPSKKPESFDGLAVPGYLSYLVIGISVAYGLVLTCQGKIGLNRGEIAFCALLILTPVPGLIGHAASSPELIDWRNHVIDDSVADNMLGFRPFILQATMFLFCAPVFARYWGRGMRIAVFFSLTIHFIWGLAQFIYPVAPFVLHSLPVKVGGDCLNSAGFCAKIVRAVGLTPNPFFFSFIYFSAAALYISRWKEKGGKVSLIISMLSISRSFMIASIIVLISRVRSKGIAIASIFVAIVYAMFGDEISSIILSRFVNDSSVGSRSSTNSLALKEVFFNGNIFGIGFENKYFTDSTFATLMLGGGIFSVALYSIAWIIFFREWIKFTNPGDKGLLRAFAIAFFVLQTLVGSADAQPGGLLFFIAFWISAFGERESTHQLKQPCKVEV